MSHLLNIGIGLFLACLTAGDSSAIELEPPPARPGSLAPFLATTEDGAMLSWLEPVASSPDTKTYRLQVARLDGSTWSDPVTIVQRSDFFANWADVPTISHDGTRWLATWLQMSGPGTYSYDIAVANSPDGLSWTHMGTLNDDRTMTEHGFVSLVPDGDATRAFWLDGREMSAGSDSHGHGSGAMTLRTALISDTIGESSVIDEMVCECCPTSATMTAEGPIVLVRNRTGEEVRDIECLRSQDDFSSPVMVYEDNWTIAGCPVNGPAVEAKYNLVAAAWYTAAPERRGVWATFSDDAGATFGTPIQLDGEDAIGRVDLVMLEDGRAAICWLSSRDDGSLLLRTVHRSGRMGEVQSLASIDSGRRSGVPRLAALPGTGDRLLAAWTSVGDESHGLRTAIVDACPDATP
ncbi:MAG: hypothetical protein CMJ36_03495 [Phycisphaerae bacterium]|nr:hypothetical protein [Phycisphaerae bacterium]